MSYFLHADTFFLPHCVERKGYLEVRDDGKFGNYYAEDHAPIGKAVDYSGWSIAPGYVDTHIHGLVNEDVMKSDWAGVDKISNALLQAGVTSWLPTTITASDEELTATCRKFAANQHQETGAKILGIHFEGPFFTEKHAGAENPKFMCDPSIDMLKNWLKASNNMLIKLALAPERTGTVDFIEEARKLGVTIALGHSDATYRQALDAVNAGATIFTHTFNGMNQFSHHCLNLAGAAMTLKHVYDELICDGHHVEPEAAKLLINSKGAEHIVLITDCMQAGMMPDGDYLLGELPVYVKAGMARLKSNNSLAGSVLLLKDAVKNLVSWGICSKEDAIQMATYTPAKSLNLEQVAGVIAPGRAADFIVLDSNMNLRKTYLDGQLRYEA